MLVQLSSEKNLPETAVKPRKRPFMAVVVNCQPLKSSFVLFASPLKPEVKFYDYTFYID